MFFRVAREGVHAAWAYLVTILSVVVAFFMGQIPLGIVIAKAEDPQRFLQALDLSALGYPSHLILLLFMLSFVAALGMLYLMVRTVHRRTFRTLVTSRIRVDWRRFGFAFGTAAVLSILLDLSLYWQDPGNYTWRFEAGQFFPLLLVVLVFIPIQTSFEELFFRGYLMQGIGLRTHSRWAPLLLTSVLFGLLHLGNPEVQTFSATVMLPFYIGFGLLLGICTLMDEGTEIALGFHAANNVYGATVVSFPGSALQTHTLWRMESLDGTLIIPCFLVVSAVFVGIMAWRYDWQDWGKLLR